MHPALRYYYYSSSQGGSPYSTELQAVIARWDALGHTKPSDAWLLAVDEEFIIKAVADGSWAKFDRLKIFALNNAALNSASLVDFKNPSSDLTVPQAGPVFSTPGWAGDAVGAYLDLMFNPVTDGVNYTQNSASRGAWVYTAPTTGTRIDGAMTGNNSMRSQSTTVQRINQSTNSLNAAADLTGTGYKAIDRPDSANVNLFNGVTKSTRTATSAAMENTDQALFREGAAFSNVRISMYYMGGSMTDTQHNNIRNNFQAFLTRIGL
jgi:hypothetical protein